MVEFGRWKSWPQYGLEEERAVLRVIKSNQLYAAHEVQEFESRFASYVGTRYAIGVCNATAGLHLALAALGVGVDNEVLVTPYSWISTASCVLMQNAVPVFADIELESYGIDPVILPSLVTTSTKAVITTHMFGNPCKIEDLVNQCKKLEIPLIEDASHAHGASFKDKMLGSWGTIGVFSLHQRKNLSVGDGGVIVTNDEAIYRKLFKLRSFGDEELSYNYRMTEFAAAIGLAGLEKLDEQNLIRATNVEALNLAIETPRISVVTPNPDGKSSYHAVLLKVAAEVTLDEIQSLLTKFDALGIPCRKTWSPLHLHPHFNPTKIPARGLPWHYPTYNGQMKGKFYHELNLPNVTSVCPNRLLELYVHPPADAEDMRFVAALINNHFSE